MTDLLPRRLRRRMPKAEAIAEYWFDIEDPPFDVHPDNPACFACGRREAEWGDLERCHLVDRYLGGLDVEPNLVMLCHACHLRQPSSEIDEIISAIYWVVEEAICHGVGKRFYARILARAKGEMEERSA